MLKEEIEVVIKEAVELAVHDAVKEAVVEVAAHDAIKEAVGVAVHEAVHSELGSYKIPKEQHYKDHLWIDELRAWQGQIRNSTIKAVVGTAIAAAGALIFYGFLFFGGKK